MAKFIVNGGKKLSGSIRPQGSKNEAFMVINAAMLASGKTTIYNVPKINDIEVHLNLLRALNINITECDNQGIIIDTVNIKIENIYTEAFAKQFKSIRGGLTIIAPLLARFKKVILYKPGGDKIGRRNIDAHLHAFESLGCEIKFNSDNQSFDIVANQLKGMDLLLDEASVTATANAIMLATVASGTTTIYNAACEPHIQQLCKMLCAMGAKISGIGSNLLTIVGISELTPTTHTIEADYLEIGGFISLAASTFSDIRIENCNVKKNLPTLRTFRNLGISIEENEDSILVKGTLGYALIATHNNDLLTISDATWPGVPADLISVSLVAAIHAKGTVLIHQKMFESRLFFVDSLIDMGAKIILCDPHRAVVVGNNGTRLRGMKMISPDIRAGMALLIAALSADGQSVIENVEQIDRGYQNLLERLKLLGAIMERVE